MTDFSDPIAVALEPEVLASRRAFPQAQAMLAGAPKRMVAPAATVTWHGSSVHPETGAVALVDPAGPLADLVGEVIRLTRVTPGATRRVFVYVVGSASLDGDLSLTRRAFLSLGLLALSDITAIIETVA